MCVLAGTVLSRMMSDSTYGAKAMHMIMRFLPKIIVYNIKEKVAKAPMEFDKDHESPEIIWDSDMRTQVQPLSLSRSV